MLEDIGKNNNEIPDSNNNTILLVTDDIQHYQQQFNNYNINNYKITFINWNDILTFITNNNDTKCKNLELIILDISTSEDAQINKESTTTNVEKIKKILYDKRIFFILPSESMIEKVVSMGICTKEDIRIHPFSVFDVIDLISTTNKKERLYRLQLKDHCMHTYSSPHDKVKDAIRFLKIGIENNEATLLLLDKDIKESYLKSQMASHNIDIRKLQDDGLLKIAYSEDWYLSTNQKNNTNKNKITIDNEKIYVQFFNLLDQATKKEEKKGLRIFGMMDCFFEHGLVDEIVDYDCMMPPKFNKSILSICAYNDKHIAQLSEDQIRKLILTHSKVWI